MLSRIRIALLVGACLLAGAGAVVFQTKRLLADPNIAWLFPEEGAQWVRMHTPEGPNMHGKEDFTAAFRTRFTVAEPPARAMLFYRPFRHVTVFLNGVPLVQTEADLDTWKQRYSLDLAPLIQPGENTLVLSALNRTGPPAVLAYSHDLGIYSGLGWEAKDHERTDWEPAETIESPQTNTVALNAERADKVFLSMLPYYLPLFLLAALATLLWPRLPEGHPLRRWTPTPGGVRWILLIAWAVLSANNIAKLPFGVGFDSDGHFQYILYIVRKHSIPFADQGWQMFQSPLYYLVCAPLYLLFLGLYGEAGVTEALRIVPALCGALQVQMCYLIMREVYPKRNDLQILGIVLGGLLPINLYLSQNLANEPPVALFCSMLILATVQLERHREERWHAKTFAGMGVLLGLAMLTKVSALLLCGPLVLAIAYVALTREGPWFAKSLAAVKAFGLLFGVAFVICGWYYLRNWYYKGAPFIGGWDEIRGYIWWQEPGYRTTSQFLSFGHALTYPMFSAVHGFWDGFYSTLWLDGYASSVTEFHRIRMWDFDHMLSCAWLALLPAAALLLGACVILLRPKWSLHSGHFFALLCLATFIGAMAHLSLRISSFSTVKASYTLSLVTCYALVAAPGFDLLTRKRYLRAAVTGGMTCWAVANYLAYWVH